MVRDVFTAFDEEIQGPGTYYSGRDFWERIARYDQTAVQFILDRPVYSGTNLHVYGRLEHSGNGIDWIEKDIATIGDTNLFTWSPATGTQVEYDDGVFAKLPFARIAIRVVDHEQDTGATFTSGHMKAIVVLRDRGVRPVHGKR